MLGYLIAGLVLGGSYAISTLAIVVTYNATRVFNFAQAGMAFFIAYCFHELVAKWGWNTWLALVVSVVVIAPLLGVALWALLLGRLADRTDVVKIACMIGLQVAIVSVTLLWFGQTIVYGVKGVVGSKALFHLGGVAVGRDQAFAVLCSVLVAVGALLVLHRTAAGLVVRGAVDSPMMAVLVGTNTNVVQACTWAVGTALAGLAGILVAPTASLDSTAFANVMIASFAGAVIGRLTRLWLAFGGAVLVGIVQSVAVNYAPSSGFIATALQPSIPFFFMIVAVLVWVRSPHVRQQLQSREAVRLQGRVERDMARSASLLGGSAGAWDRYLGWGVLVAAVVVVPFVISQFWLGAVGLGLTYSLIFLSYRLVTGEGGVVGLAQVSFAGIGACVTAQFATNAGLPFFVAVLLAVVVAAACGGIVGLLCLPLGQLYAAITTFAFALLADDTVFNWNRFSNDSSGVSVNPPNLASIRFDSPKSFYVLMVVLLAVVSAYLIRVRRSRSGLAFAVIRVSRNRAETFGLRIFAGRLALFAAGAGVAALGGALEAGNQLVALPVSFASGVGLVWFAVAMAQGSTSIGGLTAAGISVAIIPALFSKYVPSRLGEVPDVLFGLAAIALVNNPNGVNLKLRTQMRALAARLSSRPGPASDGPAPLGSVSQPRGAGLPPLARSVAGGEAGK